MFDSPYTYRAIFVGAIIVCALLLAACGGGDGEPGDTGPVHDISTPSVDCTSGACK